MRWNSLEMPLKAQVKHNVLQALVSADEGSRKAAAQAVSKIAAIEVRAHSWPELIPALLTNAAAPALALPLKATTLTCIGYVCSELVRHRRPCL